MSELVVTRLDTLDELRAIAHEWDALWQRSEVAMPAARAELIALWCESFAPDWPLRVFVVRQCGRMVAALPLVERRVLGWRIPTLPGNYWSPAGDLLLDPAADAEQVCDALLAGLRQQAGGLLWLDALHPTAPRWLAFARALERAGLATVERRRCWISMVQIDGAWDEYFAQRTANHRKYFRKAVRRAERQGGLELVCHDELTPDEVGPLLRSCFELEASGWKGEEEGAVLHAPGVWAFYLRQAEQLAAWGELKIVTLEDEGRMIAFEYGWRSKGVYFSPKVGYDEAVSELCPGQLLRGWLIEQFHERRDVRWIDFTGPTSPATERWATHGYPIDRIVAPLSGRLAPLAVTAYRDLWPLVRKIVRGRNAHDAAAAPPQGEVDVAAMALAAADCQPEPVAAD